MIYIGHNNKTLFLLTLEKELNTTDNIVVNSWDEIIDNRDAWLKLSTEQELFYNNHSDATPKEVYDMHMSPDPVKPGFEPESPLESDEITIARLQKLVEIGAQDKFSNKFFVSVRSEGVEIVNQELWIDRDTRNSLLNNTLPALQADGETKTKLWTTGMPPQSIEVPIIWALDKLPYVEIYAKRTYDLKASNEAAVYAATTVEDIAKIDVKGNYPLFLTFELNLDNDGGNCTETIN